jgi:hypothetical protein
MEGRMAFDVRPAGSVLQFPRYERVQPRRGVVLNILRGLGMIRAKRRIKRIDELVCPFEFVVVPGAEAAWTLEELARQRPDCMPVVLGPPETAANTLAPEQSSSLEALLKELDRLDLVGWLAERLAKLKQLAIEPPRGPWPATPRTSDDELICVRSLRGNREFFPEVVVALVPTTEPALLALHLGYGDWNDCPPSVVHAGIARRWSKAHGAAPVAFAEDVVEYRVARPVSTREQAMELALEQFSYCPDIVLQGTETLERLAVELLGARYWYFWWD